MSVLLLIYVIPVYKRFEYLPVIIGHATVNVDVNVQLKGSTKYKIN